MCANGPKSYSKSKKCDIENTLRSHPLGSPKVKTLGVTLDSKLTFRPHITNLCKSCFYHIRAIRHIRSALTKDMSQTIGCSLVSSRLDYANSLFVGVSDLEVKRLQRVQNSLTRV